MNGVPLIVIIGGAAVVALLVLAVVLVVRGRTPRVDEEPAESFLGSRPQDTFAGLGEPDAPAEIADDEFRLDWGHGDDDLAPRAQPVHDGPPPAAARHEMEARPAAVTEPPPAVESEKEAPAVAEAGGADAAAGEAGGAARPEDETAGVTAASEETSDAATRAETADDVAAKAEAEAGRREQTDTSITAATGATEAGADEIEGQRTHGAAHEIEAETGGGETARATAGGEDESEAEKAAAAAGQTPRAPRMVPLSDIIVTTSRKEVDLNDPEVRRMLTELVRYEIDQAAEFSAAGQSVDAVLQLTEAEKVSRALGMDETAERIKSMMRELRD